MKTSSLSKQEENPILLLRTKLQDTVGDNIYIYIYLAKPKSGAPQFLFNNRFMEDQGR